jgi:hypothetical protein
VGVEHDEVENVSGSLGVVRAQDVDVAQGQYMAREQHGSQVHPTQASLVEEIEEEGEAERGDERPLDNRKRLLLIDHLQWVVLSPAVAPQAKGQEGAHEDVGDNDVFNVLPHRQETIVEDRRGARGFFHLLPLSLCF